MEIRKLVESKLFEDEDPRVRHLDQHAAWKQGYDVSSAGCDFAQLDLGFINLDLLSCKGNDDFDDRTEVNGYWEGQDENYMFFIDEALSEKELYNLSRDIEDANCKDRLELAQFLEKKGFKSIV